MSSLNARTRLQAPYKPDTSENPYLKPLPPQVDPFGSRGRFQQVTLGAHSAEEQTRVPSQTVVYEEKVVPGDHTKTETTTTTTVVED